MEGPVVEVGSARPPSAVGDATVVSLRGPLGADVSHPLGVAVTLVAGLLREHTHLVVDLSGARLAHVGTVHAFPAALERAGGWPTVTLALAAPTPALAAVLASSGVARRVPVHADVATALAHASERPELVRAWWSFPVDPQAPGRARSALRRVCRDWSVDGDVEEAAEIVLTELVTNAVEHASSPSVVEVDRTDDRLRMTVRDFDRTELPVVAAPDPRSVRGRGLAMVAAVSRSWGVHAHGDGKTVWSELAI